MSHEWNDVPAGDSASYTRLSTELERQKQLIDTWRIALLMIVRLPDSPAGRIALEALDKDIKP